MKNQTKNIVIRSIAVIVILTFVITAQAGLNISAPCGILNLPDHGSALNGTYIVYFPLAHSIPIENHLSIPVSGTTLSVTSDDDPIFGTTHAGTQLSSYRKPQLYLLHLVLRN